MMDGIDLTQKCILLLGGSFDPVHIGHVEIGRHFCRVFGTDTLRLIPTGNPWQKASLTASVENRIAMLNLAFADTGLRTIIDRQEVERTGATYSFDTLSNIRKEVGEQTSLIFLMGSDQIHRLNTWYRWRELFALTNFAVMTRPGSPDPLENLPAEIADIVLPNLSSPEEIENVPAGRIYIDTSLRIDVSSSEIRRLFRNDQNPEALIPPSVLEYINAKKLYRKSYD